MKVTMFHPNIGGESTSPLYQCWLRLLCIRISMHKDGNNKNLLQCFGAFTRETVNVQESWTLTVRTISFTIVIQFWKQFQVNSNLLVPLLHTYTKSGRARLYNAQSHTRELGLNMKPKRKSCRRLRYSCQNSKRNASCAREDNGKWSQQRAKWKDTARRGLTARMRE